MTTINRRLVSTATGQLGALTREQAHEIGVSDNQLRSRVKSGFLSQSGPNVFRLNGTGLEPRSQLSDLCVDVGGLVVASRFTAAALHGFDGYELSSPFDVTVLRGRFVRRNPHRVHTVKTLPQIDREEVDGIVRTRAARTLIDLARHECPEQLTIALDSALRDRIVTERSLHRRIVALRRQGMHGIPQLVEVIEGSELSRGAHSWLEREFLRLMSKSGIARPEPQVVVGRAGRRLVRVDFRFTGSPVVVEVLGYRWHRSPSNLRRDSERLNAMLSAGLRPYQFTYEQIVESPTEVVRDVRAALEA
jgi:hypothetical protein